MGKHFRSSARTSVSHRPDKTEKAIQALSDDPIFIPHDAEAMDETPLPDDNNAPPLLLIVGVVSVALLCVWKFAPALPGNLIRQLLHFAGQ